MHAGRHVHVSLRVRIRVRVRAKVRVGYRDVNSMDRSSDKAWIYPLLNVDRPLKYACERRIDRATRSIVALE